MKGSGGQPTGIKQMSFVQQKSVNSLILSSDDKGTTGKKKKA